MERRFTTAIGRSAGIASPASIARPASLAGLPAGSGRPRWPASPRPTRDPCAASTPCRCGDSSRRGSRRRSGMVTCAPEPDCPPRGIWGEGWLSIDAPWGRRTTASGGGGSSKARAGAGCAWPRSPKSRALAPGCVDRLRMAAWPRTGRPSMVAPRALPAPVSNGPALPRSGPASLGRRSKGCCARPSGSASEWPRRSATRLARKRGIETPTRRRSLHPGGSAWWSRSPE